MQRKDIRTHPAIQTTRLVSDSIFNTGDVLFKPYVDGLGNPIFDCQIPLKTREILFSGNKKIMDGGINDFIFIGGNINLGGGGGGDGVNASAGMITNNHGDISIAPVGDNININGKNLINVGDIISSSASELATINIADTLVANDDALLVAVFNLTKEGEDEVKRNYIGINLDLLVIGADNKPKYLTARFATGFKENEIKHFDGFRTEQYNGELSILLDDETKRYCGSLKVIEIPFHSCIDIN